MFKKFFILMDEATDGTSPSGYGQEATPTFELPKEEGVKPAAVEATPVASTEKPVEAPKTGESGYETDESKSETPVTEEKPVETPTTEEEYNIEVEGVKPEEIKDIVDLAKNNKLNKEQATELVKFYKAEMDKAAQEESAYQAKVKETYANWAKELREDKEFGGANFVTNVNNVNTVLGTHFPSLAKSLQTKGARLHPDTMRELNKVYHLLHGEKALVEGDTATSKKDSNPWDYYNQGKQ